MAKMYPSRQLDFNGSVGEEEVYNALKKLPDEYFVFHSLAWSHKKTVGVSWGEADFTIFHRIKGMLVIEVKSGRIDYHNHTWFQNNKEMKDPMIQANRSKFHLVDVMRFLPMDQKIWAEPLIWFPSVDSKDFQGEYPVNCNSKNVLFRDALSDPQLYIDRAYSYYDSEQQTKLSPEWFQFTVKKLMPEFSTIESISSSRNAMNHEMIRLTNEQSILIDYLELQQVAAIQGGAGTGKTMLAIEKAKRLSEDGSVLFLCFNKYLLNYLKKEFSIVNVSYENLNSLVCRKLAVPQVDTDDITRFLNNYDRYEWEFKNIIIDECQDFDDEHIELLSAIASTEQGCFYVFYDRNQFVKGRIFPKWLERSECRLVLNKNCRNTQYIAVTSGKPIDFMPKMPHRSVSGVMPNMILLKNRAELLDNLRLTIAQYSKQGVSFDQICILTTKTEDSSFLGGLGNIGIYKIMDERSPKGVLFTTCRKFKGLESDVILLVDVDKETFSNEENRRIFYVGSSRAKFFLEIFSIGIEPDFVHMANNLSQNNYGDNFKKALALELNVAFKQS